MHLINFNVGPGSLAEVKILCDTQETQEIAKAIASGSHSFFVKTRVVFKSKASEVNMDDLMLQQRKISDLKEQLARIDLRRDYNVKEIKTSKTIQDMGEILIDILDEIKWLGLTFDGEPPYLHVGVVPCNCILDTNVYEALTHIASSADKSWDINDDNVIVFNDINKL